MGIQSEQTGEQAPNSETDGGTPRGIDSSNSPQIFPAPPNNFSIHNISPMHDVKLNGPDTRVSEGFKAFLEYQSKPKHMLEVGESDKETLEKAARENVAYAFNEGYLKPLSEPNTSAAIKKQITDAILERAHGKATENVNVKHTGAIGVVTISSEDIARIITAANERAAACIEAVVIPE